MKRIFLFLFGVVFISCGDADLFRFDKFGKPEGWEPNYTLLLAKADFSVWDVFNEGVSDTSTLKKDENGRLFLEYRKPRLFTFSTDDIFLMHSEDMFFERSFPINHQHFAGGEGTAACPHYDTLTVDYKLEQIPEGVSIREAIISVESMEFLVVNNAKVGGNLKITCENLYSLENGDKISVVFSLKPSQTNYTFSTELPNLKVVFNGEHIVPLQFVLMVDDTTQTVMNQNIVIDIATKGVDYKDVNLSLPEMTLPVPFGRVLPNIDFLNTLSGKFNFTNPQLTLTARSKGLGANFKLQGMEFTGRNETDSVTLKTEEIFEFTGENQNLKETEAVFKYDNLNSNIADFAALPPRQEISYGKGQLQCGGENIRFYDDGELAFDLTMQFPLQMSDAHLVYYDTISELNLKDADKILEAKLLISGINSIKMDLSLPEIYLLDEGYNQIGLITNEKNNYTFKAATGEESMESGIETLLTKENLRQLSVAKYIVLKILADSGDHKEVSMDEHSRLKLNLKLDACVDMGDVIFD